MQFSVALRGLSPCLRVEKKVTSFSLLRASLRSAATSARECPPQERAHGVVDAIHVVGEAEEVVKGVRHLRVLEQLDVPVACGPQLLGEEVVLVPQGVLAGRDDTGRAIAG